VTADTLGLYLALALGRKVVGLFGPTSAERCHTYGRGMKLTPDLKLNCIPCCEGECGFERSCVETISPRRVAEAAEILLHADVLEK
jgi:heptosyltransferase-2